MFNHEETKKTKKTRKDQLYSGFHLSATAWAPPRPGENHYKPSFALFVSSWFEPIFAVLI
jgi:hypothetical protein